MTRTSLALLTGALLASLTAGVTLHSSPARAAGAVVIYCGVNEEWCRAASTAFEQKTGIHVDMTRQSAGEIFARLRAEKRQPARRHLVRRHRRPASPGRRRRLDRAHTSPPSSGPIAALGAEPGQAFRQSDRRTLLGALGFGYNEDELAKRKVAGAGLLVRPAQARLQGRGADGRPELLGHRLDHAGHHRADHGRGPALRLPEEARPQHRPVHQRRRRAGPGASAAAKPWSASPSSTT